MAKLINTLGELFKLIQYWRGHALASRSISGTFLRFIRWQIAYRLLNVKIIWPWVGSAKLVIGPGMTGATMNIYCGLHEFADMAFLLHVLKSDDMFVDVGANVGSYTVLASAVVGAKSCCIEPIPDTFQNLKLNIVVNKIQDRVDAQCCGIGSFDGGYLSFIADQDTMNKVAPAGYQGKTLEVPIRSLDSLLVSFNAVLWKIDVEDFELDVLRGAENKLADENLLAVIMEGDGAEIRSIMQEHGFALFTYEPFSRTLVSEKMSKAGHNWLWIKNETKVSERCRQAQRTTIAGITF